MDEVKKRGRPRKVETEVVETGLTVAPQPPPVYISREDRRVLAREQRKRDRMRRKAEKAAMAIWLLNQTAKQGTSQDSPFAEGRKSKADKEVASNLEETRVKILENLSEQLLKELKED
jgi:hypothetical protein